jgi:hypothetical protein
VENDNPMTSANLDDTNQVNDCASPMSSTSDNVSQSNKEYADDVDDDDDNGNDNENDDDDDDDDEDDDEKENSFDDLADEEDMRVCIDT